MPFATDRFVAVRRWTVAGTFVLMLLVFLSAHPLMEPMDFRAFYCAGEALEQHANPYRDEPDRSCQRRVLAASSLRLDERFVVPAPLPPYALSAFGMLSSLPYLSAMELWLFVNLVALSVCIASVAKLGNLSSIITGFSLIVSAGYVSIVLGQVIPLVLAAALYAALCARRGNGIGAAIGATLTAAEPHLALPIWLSLFVFLPGARKPLAVAAAFLAIVSLSSGIALNLEYLRSVIPEHARSELMDFSGQYGLSSLMVALRVPPATALATGSACYALMAAFGLALGAALRRKYGDGAFLVLTPLASVVLGGPYLHITQTVVAIPLGFLLIATEPRSKPTIACAVFAVSMLAIPWQIVGRTLPPHVPEAKAVATSVDIFRAARPDISIEIPYTTSVDAVNRHRTRTFFVATLARKLPTWAALFVLLLSATWVAFRPRLAVVGVAHAA